jgi:hypothetical protein
MYVYIYMFFFNIYIYMYIYMSIYIYICIYILSIYKYVYIYISIICNYIVSFEGCHRGPTNGIVGAIAAPRNYMKKHNAITASKHIYHDILVILSKITSCGAASVGAWLRHD